MCFRNFCKKRKRDGERSSVSVCRGAGWARVAGRRPEVASPMGEASGVVPRPSHSRAPPRSVRQALFCLENGPLREGRAIACLFVALGSSSTYRMVVAPVVVVNRSRSCSGTKMMREQ